MSFSPNRMFHFVPKQQYTSAVCERSLTIIVILVFSFWATRFCAVFIIQFLCFLGIFKRLFKSFEIKNVFYYFFIHSKIL